MIHNTYDSNYNIKRKIIEIKNRERLLYAYYVA